MTTEASVVIPTYNGSAFIRGALQSAFAQTQLPHEIVVVDDASDDGTLDLVDAIAIESPVPLKVIRLQKNCGGPARPLNVGIETASCDLIALLEQDDLMARSRIERLCRAAVRHPECALVIGRPALVVEEASGVRWDDVVRSPDDIPEYVAHRDEESFVVPAPVAFRSLMGSNFIYSNSNVMLKRRLFRQAGGFDARWRMNSDADFEFHMLTLGPIAVVNAVLCGYRDRTDSLYHSRYHQARIDGLLIRLKWGAARWDWASQETQRVYWTLRSDAMSLLRAGHVGQAMRIWKALAASGVPVRHLLSRLTPRRSGWTSGR